MKVSVHIAQQEPFSFRVYRENVAQELRAFGVKLVPFGREDPIPSHCNVVWTPKPGMRSTTRILRSSPVPVVVTIYGAAPFSIPIHQIRRAWRNRLQLYVWKALIARYWRRFGKRISAVIAISEFSARDIARAFNLPSDIMHTIHLGVAHEVFKLDGEKQAAKRPYFLHVSASHAGRKNVSRIFSAYAKLPEHTRPDLVAILTGYRGNMVDIKGTKLITHGMSTTELAKWYRGALGFVFPSLYEGFGMPILEAMACGCPVITSSTAACPEVAGDAALLVNPYSVDDIVSAMWCLMEDESSRQRLREKGLIRAKQFTWRKSAEKHLEVFERVSKSGSLPVLC